MTPKQEADRRNPMPHHAEQGKAEHQCPYTFLYGGRCTQALNHAGDHLSREGIATPQEKAAATPADRLEFVPATAQGIADAVKATEAARAAAPPAERNEIHLTFATIAEQMRVIAHNLGHENYSADELGALADHLAALANAGQAAPPLRDRDVLFEIADGPEGITLYTSGEEAVVDWAHDVPALYCTVNIDSATAKFGPFRLSKNLIAQLKHRAAAERPADDPPRQILLPHEVLPDEVAKKILAAPPIADVSRWAEQLANDSVKTGGTEAGADSGVEEARRWLVAFINAQRAKGDDNLTWQDIEDDALLYGFSIPELLTQHTADLRRQRDALQAEQERAVRLAPLIEKVRKAGNRLAWNEDDELFIRNVRAESAEHQLADVRTLLAAEEKLHEQETNERVEAERKLAEARRDLTECYVMSGADPDGNEDWRLAPRAVEEVRRMRKESDETECALAQANTLMNEIQQAAMKVEEERANPYAFVAWANVKLSAAVRSALAPEKD